MNARTAKLLRWVGYPLFYVVALLLFIYLLFPYDRVKDRIVGEVSARQTAGIQRIEIADLDGYWFTGVEAEGVQLIPQPTPDADAEKPKPLVIDAIHARASLLRLLVGTTHVNFGADAFGGSISGSTSDAGGGRMIDLEFENVNIGDLPMLAQTVGLPLKGVLNGVIDLELPEGQLAKAEGKIALVFSDFVIGDGKAKIRNTLALPPINAGEVVIEGEAEGGQFTINKFTANGKDLEASADGKIRFREPVPASLAELNLHFKFSNAYRNRNDITRVIFGSPDSKVPAMFDIDPRVKRAKRPDGSYAFRVTGPLTSPNLGGGGGAAPARPSTLGAPDDE